MAQLIPNGIALQSVLPVGAYVVRLEKTWGLYAHPTIMYTWLVWKVPAGLNMMVYPGRRTIGVDMDRLGAYANQRSRTACAKCPG